MTDELSIISGASGRQFAINGRGLDRLVEIGDLRCVLDQPREVSRGFARQLILRAASELPSGRVPLYICPQCGDLGCGAVTVRVAEIDDCFVWSELSIESFDGTRPVTWRVRDVRDFYFAKAQYLGTIY